MIEYKGDGKVFLILTLITIAYVLSALFAYRSLRNFYMRRQHIKPDASDVIMVLAPVVNLCAAIAFLDGDKMAQGFFRIK